jgi:hypothetical protein
MKETANYMISIEEFEILPCYKLKGKQFRITVLQEKEETSLVPQGLQQIVYTS